jgi:hypothetical protein
MTTTMDALSDTEATGYDDAADVARGWSEMEEAFPAYQLAEDYDTGKVVEFLHNRDMADLLRRAGEGYRMSMLSGCIDAVAARLQIQEISSPNTAAQEAIDRVAEANNYPAREAHLLRMVCTYGDAYEMVQKIDVETDEVIDDDLLSAGVAISTLNPKHCRAIYGDTDDMVPEFVINRWKIKLDGETHWRAVVRYDDHESHWLSEGGEDRPSGWVPWLNDTDDPESWYTDGDDYPYDEIPITHHRNAIPYGKPEHLRGYGAQNAFMTVTIGQASTVADHSMQTRLLLADDTRVLDSNKRDPLGDAVEDGDEDTINRSRKGSAIKLHGIKSVHEFSAADPKVFLDPAHFYIYCIATLTNTPLHLLDMRGQVPSGESLKVANAPADRKAKLRQHSLRPSFRATWRNVLKLLDIPEPQVSITWMSPALAAGVPIDWTELHAKREMGVPSSTLLVEAGYSRSEAEQWAQPSVADNIDLLDRLGQALDSLSTASGGEPLFDVSTVERVTAVILARGMKQAKGDDA